ncbi:MAG: polynucleotide adenylyltransferase PcnB [Thiotrichaceae bacterium]|nr:polynucleotide adenylyltransferase PcnB [Thiotrichaceae bacterium]
MVDSHTYKNHSITKKDLCPRAIKVLESLNKAGHEAYLVGGAVRDLLLDKTPKDFDIATAAHPEEVKRTFRNSRLIGRRFRLAHVYFGREYLEVATFRAPHDAGSENAGKTANDGRITHDNVYGTLEEDALRRDFTINALFYDLKNKEIKDYAGGIQDIQDKQIRLIGDPEVRYREDPVRMLRAIRFAVKLDFTIHPETEAPIYKMGSLLKNIAPARLFDEALKLFHGGQALETFQALRRYDLFQYLFPQTENDLLEEQDESFLTFIEQALKNTDQRINSGMSTTPAFLYSVLLWARVQQRFMLYRESGQPIYQSTHLAATDALNEQVKSTAIPRRFSNVSREIWILQSRFERKDCGSSLALIEHRRFRAAYDFHCLRAQAGHIDISECEWWTEFQKLNHEEQLEQCKEFARPRKKRRRRKKK